MASGLVNDPHSERGNACPRNRFNITDYAELQLVEAPLVASRIGEMRDRGVNGKFDIPHIHAIHRYLFQDVFLWAREFRAVNISKGNANFGPAMHIAGALKELFGRLRRRSCWRGLLLRRSLSGRRSTLARSTPSIPFARATGERSVSLFGSLACMQVICRRGSLAGTGFTQQQMIDASIASHTRGDNTGLATIVEAALFSACAGKSSSE